MGSFCNVEIHALRCNHPSGNWLVAVFCQPPRGTHHRLPLSSSLAASVWLFPAGCSHLAVRSQFRAQLVGLLRLGRRRRRAAGPPRLSASFTAVPYVELRYRLCPTGLRHRGADDGADHLDDLRPCQRWSASSPHRRWSSAVGVGLVAEAPGILCGSRLADGYRWQHGRVGHHAAAVLSCCVRSEDIIAGHAFPTHLSK